MKGEPRQPATYFTPPEIVGQRAGPRRPYGARTPRPTPAAVSGFRYDARNKRIRLAADLPGLPLGGLA